MAGLQATIGAELERAQRRVAKLEQMKELADGLDGEAVERLVDKAKPKARRKKAVVADKTGSLQGKIIEALALRAMTSDDLAKRFGASKRDVLDALSVLEGEGEAVNGRRHGWRRA